MERLARLWRRICDGFCAMMDADVYDTVEDRKRQAEQDHDETPRPPHS